MSTFVDTFAALNLRPAHSALLAAEPDIAREAATVRSALAETDNVHSIYSDRKFSGSKATIARDKERAFQVLQGAGYANKRAYAGLKVVADAKGDRGRDYRARVALVVEEAQRTLSRDYKRLGGT